ncbi:sensor histidine kinase [Sphingomicrobium flavum]|uniref:sensor histidine kinase n=1 Tax=Sphingomicrobium flavum TaxID=1229164 RepID=UPI0021AD7D5E|nr:ATP-binding protein [Sphingomicrobium flavum]
MSDIAPLLDAIDEPAILIEGHQLVAANRAARTVFARRLAHNDIRMVIRHPAVLAAVDGGSEATLDVEGIGGVDRPWQVRMTPLGEGRMLIRLIDRAAARAAEKMRVDFVANASHELRTPLATILGYAETLADEDAPPEEMRRKFAGTVRSEAKRMLQIVEDLMALSRIEADRFVEPKADVDIGQLVREAITAIGPYAEQRCAELNFDIEGDLPFIRGDKAQIRQLIDNLIGNAIRYGCNRTSCTVDIRLGKTRDRIRLEVRDHGDGIAAEHLPRLTERFYRVDPGRSRNSGGTGLGLAIVKHIAERHRARLDIASALGKGTRVIVDFPLAD